MLRSLANCVNMFWNPALSLDCAPVLWSNLRTGTELPAANNLNTMKWTRIAILAAIATAVAAGVAFYSSASRDTASETTAPPTAPDPALVERTSVRAAAGDAAAQLQMGLWYMEGQGQPQDSRQAAEWLRKAAESGNAEAQYRLGSLYQAGRGIGRNFTNALSWFQKAAAQQHVAALFNVGSMYEAGQGTATDSTAAARYFKQAAELGDAYAQYNMARRCGEGHGVTKSLVEAWKWYELANAGGVPDVLHARRAIESQLSAGELKAARRAAAEFRQRAGAGKQPVQ